MSLTYNSLYIAAGDTASLCDGEGGTVIMQGLHKSAR